jgi:hypothetical protein
MASDRFAEALTDRAPDSDERVLAAIDMALQELTSMEPGPNFVSRLRAHVEHAPRWMPSILWIPASTAAFAVLVAALVISRLPSEPSTVRETSASRPLDLPIVAPADRAADPSRNAAARETKRAARLRRHAAPESTRLAQMPEVLVPEQQRESVSRLFTSLRAGRPEVISMLMSLHAGEAPIESRGLNIEPLRIEPVVVSALPSASIVDK